MCVCGGGVTCIEVEQYESEGQRYELCSSERNPADNKKTGSSSTIMQQEWLTGSVNLPEAQDTNSRMWIQTWDQRRSQQASALLDPS